MVFEATSATERGAWLDVLCRHFIVTLVTGHSWVTSVDM